MDHDHHSHGAAGHHHVAFDSPEMAAHAELEAEVLDGLLTEATAALVEACHRLDVRVDRVLDVGSGPGVGTCALAQRFPSATVVAVDASQPMLERAAARAERLGLADRVELRHAELPEGLESLGAAEVAWASMVVHHVGDEVAALRRLRALVEPGGLLALVERADPVRVLPAGEDLGRPGLWDRLDGAWEAWFAGMRADLQGATTSADYPAMLAEAGFEVVVDRVVTHVADAPLDARSRRFAHDLLVRTQTALAHHADAADLDALGVLVDEHADGSILRRDDALLRASRHLYVARPAQQRPEP